MSDSTEYVNLRTWRAEDAIREIFQFEQEERLDPGRSICLAWLKSGARRCEYFDEIQYLPERSNERIRLAAAFAESTLRDDLKNFQADVMRFIELAVCHQFHVHKMEDAAQAWFDKQEEAAAVTKVGAISTTGIVSPAIRHYSTGPANDVKMKKYIKNREKEQLRRSIAAPLDKKDQNDGELYITISSHVPGYIKIGYTSQSLEQRFARARRDCDIEIQCMYTTGRIPHAKRLESIVHNELANKRYRFIDQCQFCLARPGKQHEEWFQTSVEYARAVAEYWKKKMLNGMYDKASGGLTPSKRDKVLISASPENIKAREHSMSPKNYSARKTTDSPHRPSPPESPTPKPRTISQRPSDSLSICVPSPKQKSFASITKKSQRIPLSPTQGATRSRERAIDIVDGTLSFSSTSLEQENVTVEGGKVAHSDPSESHTVVQNNEDSIEPNGFVPSRKRTENRRCSTKPRTLFSASLKQQEIAPKAVEVSPDEGFKPFDTGQDKNIVERPKYSHSTSSKPMDIHSEGATARSYQQEAKVSFKQPTYVSNIRIGAGKSGLPAAKSFSKGTQLSSGTQPNTKDKLSKCAPENCSTTGSASPNESTVKKLIEFSSREGESGGRITASGKLRLLGKKIEFRATTKHGKGAKF